MPGHEMNLGRPVGLHELGRVLERGSGTDPARQTGHAGAIAAYGYLIALRV